MIDWAGVFCIAALYLPAYVAHRLEVNYYSRKVKRMLSLKIGCSAFGCEKSALYLALSNGVRLA